MRKNSDNGVTLSIAANTRGFGYVVFEHPDLIMDWGVKDVRKNKLRDSLLKARVLMHMLQPAVLVVEDVHHVSCRRSKRVRVLISKVAELGKRRGLEVVRVSREEMLRTFARAHAHNKDDIAAVVAKLVPELAPRLPPRRRIWESEHYSMAIFEAAALAVTHFARREKSRKLGVRRR